MEVGVNGSRDFQPAGTDYRRWTNARICFFSACSGSDCHSSEIPPRFAMAQGALKLYLSPA